MSSVLKGFAPLTAGLALLLAPPTVSAQEIDETWLINAHGTAARSASDLDGGADVGGSLGAGVYRSISPWVQVGGRLSGAVMPIGPDLAATGVDDPLVMGTMAGMLRVRPFADALDDRRGTGLWVEAGGGPAMVDERLTGAVDAGIGYTFALDGGVAVGPGLRYMHAFDADPRGARDVQVAMVGIELSFLDRVRPAYAERAEPAPTLAAVPSEPGDSDGDGVADRFDRCPDAPETADGINDHDGCPDDGALTADRDARVVVDQALVFAPDGSTLTTRGTAALDAVAAMYDRDAPRAIILRGHVDADGGRHDAPVSDARAGLVRAALVERGVPEQIVFTEAYVPSQTAPAQLAQARMEFVFDR